MRHRSSALALAAIAWLVPALAHAAAYGIYEQGAAAIGMAGATTASVRDASALFYNPGALVGQKGGSLLVGGTWLATRTSFAGIEPYPGFGVTEEMKTGNFFPPTVYLVHALGSRAAWGVGLDAPFGLGIEWKDPDTFTGRLVVTKGVLRALNGNATLAYAPASWLSLGAGFDALMAKVELDRRVNFLPTTGGQPRDDASVTLESGYKPGYGWNAGALLTPAPEWRIGVNYRARVNVKIDDGSATFTQIASGDTARDRLVAQNMPANQTVQTRLEFPALLSTGVAWTPAREWTVEADFNWALWSAFDALPLTFPSDPALNQVLVENYQDQFRLSLGAEHRLPGFTYRFGYYFDQAAAPTATVTALLPDANRHGATVGFGRPLGRMWLDAYDMVLFFEKRSTEGQNRDHFDGVYKSFVNGLGANLTYRW